MAVRLREAREARGWSQARLLHEIERHRAAEGLSAVSRASLKVYISEWENGRRTIGPAYRAVLRKVFGMTDAELFASDGNLCRPEDPYSELAKRIEKMRAVDARLVLTLAEQTELFRTLDRQMGAPALVDQMQRHLETLESALAYSVLPSARRPVAQALSGAATLAGWQALDTGSVDRAWRHYELEFPPLSWSFSNMID